MTEKYDPYQNAIAERVNRILKHEFNIQQGFNQHVNVLEKLISESVIFIIKKDHI